ncbi:MAG: ACT domain-containing protein, partial [Ruminococcus sp.]|nr:ACT domain-containing protein [Ruminococcus sp.]
HKVSGICAEFNVNVIEVTQSVLQDMFAMIMLVDISSIKGDFSELVDRMESLGKELGLSIHTMHEDIFNSMHTI